MYFIILCCLLLVNCIESKADESTGIIFLGDSRTVGMEMAIDCPKNVFFIAEVGKGYEWFITEAIDEIEKVIDENTYNNWIIVSNLGVNDLKNAEKYKHKYKDLIVSDWKDYSLCITSVLPVNEEKYSGFVTNESIMSFNKQFASYKHYIDLSDISDQIETCDDGLHYTKDSSKEIYEYIMCEVER